MEDIWERVGAGQNQTLVGHWSGPVPPDLRLVRISCRGAGQPLQPIVEAQELVGGPDGLLDLAAERMRAGLRRRILGEDAPVDRGAALMEALNHAPPGTVLLLEDLEHADVATLAWVGRVVDHPGRLQVPLLLGFGARPTGGEAAAIFQRLPSVTLNTSAGKEPMRLPTLPSPVLQVLRLLALAGPRADVELLAEVGEWPLREVLWALQEAVDAGVSLSDLGQGEVELSDDLQTQLQKGILPSLEGYWRRRIAAVLSAQHAPPSPVAPAVEADGPHRVVDGAAAAAPATTPRAATPAPGNVGYVERRKPVAKARVFRGTRRHAGRAAGHLAAVGELEGAARPYLIACQQAAARGAATDALELGARALQVLRRLPQAAALRAEVGMELARVQWELAVPGVCTLTEALATVQQALVDLGDHGGELHARLLTVRAGIRYEIGDSASLEGALEDLTAATRLLQVAGDVQAAARLLNEQAAVWIRMGDPVRATWLLRESLQIYDQQRQSDPRAAAEWAETQHLLARLPLHVQARENQQEEALLRALEHALAAEGVWRELGATRELARVWDTRGNLLLRQGKVHMAGESLRRAAQAQRSLGDVVGMAISMGGLAEVEAREGRPEVALLLLSDSMALNLEKGSRVGLTYNRRALTRLEPELRSAPSFAAVVAALNQAEKEAGG